MIKAVIFDLDGTLLDSIDALWRAFNAGVTVFKLWPVPKERLLELMSRGTTLAEILSHIYPALRAEATSPIIDEVIAEIRRRYLVVGGEVGLISRARELLNLLRLRGLKIGVVTNRGAAPEKQWHELRRLKVAHFIDDLVTGADAKRKPAPDALIKCLKSLELLPQECIFVGDSQVDVIAGKAAGVRTVAVTTGVARPPVLAAESPDFIFNSLHSLIDKLDLVLDRY